VHARGKRTQFTSVSLDLARIRDLGDTSYRLEQPLLSAHGHRLIEHEALLGELQKAIREEEKAERLQAAQALRYARRRREGVVNWSFDVTGVARKELIVWAQKKVQIYFTRLR